jgi:hypothetical protein
MPRGTRIAAVGATVVMTATTGAVNAAPAAADPQSGSCTASYTLYTFAELQAELPRLEQSSFDYIDKNADGFICFKYYNNPDAHPHPGQAIDNKAAPHS